MDLQIINIILSCSTNRQAWLIWVSRLTWLRSKPKFKNLLSSLGSGQRPQGTGRSQGTPARKAKATRSRTWRQIKASRTNNRCSRSSRNQKTTSMVLLPKSNRTNASERTALPTGHRSGQMEAPQSSCWAISTRRTKTLRTWGRMRPTVSSTSWIRSPTIRRCRHSRTVPLRGKLIRLKRKSD